MLINCEINDEKVCKVTPRQSIPPTENKIKFVNQFETTDFDTEINFLQIQQCTIQKFPNEIENNFTNLERLTIMQSKLRCITKFELKFPKLKILNLNFNELEFLPGDLFNYTQNIKEIHFKNNKIKFIGGKLIDTLGFLNYADFRGNININHYMSDNGDSFNEDFGHRVKVDKLKELFNDKCKPGIHEDLMIVKYEMKQQNQQGVVEHNLTNDIKKLFISDEFKDFTIKVNSKSFKVYKLIYIARCGKFAEFIRNNPNAVEMELENVNEEIFKEINYFIRHDRLNCYENPLKIYTTAGELEIESLKQHLMPILMMEKSLNEILEILTLANKFKHDELIVKAFEEIKKQFEGKELKEELARQPGKLKKLVEMKIQLEKELKEVN